MSGCVVADFRCAKGAQMTFTEKQDLFERHLAGIRSAARRVSSSYAGQSSRDFIDDAAGIVWEAMLKCDIIPALFAGWYVTVLKNAFIDRGRRQLSRREPLNSCKTGSTLTAAHSALPQADVIPCRQEELALRIRQLDWHARFSSADMKRISNWPSAAVVVVLGNFAMWHKLPPRVWDDCLQAIPTKVPFSNISPFLKVYDPSNVDVIIQWTGRKRAAVLRMIGRYRRQLRTLDCIRELNDDSPNSQS